eukprot:3328794-Pyramimonas_sp.AAC.1
MRGAACDRDAQGHPRSLSNLEVLKWWRLVPIDLEARIRRLRLLQELVGHPEEHRQVLGALLGTYGGDGKGPFYAVFTPSGRLEATAHPW